MMYVNTSWEGMSLWKLFAVKAMVTKTVYKYHVAQEFYVAVAKKDLNGSQAKYITIMRE